MKNKRNRKIWIIFSIWYVSYVATLQFFRFKFGLLHISAAFAVIGIPLMYFVDRLTKPNSN
jgi:hypothetical protein